MPTKIHYLQCVSGSVRFRHGGRERYLMLIHSVDKAGEAGRNPLVDMLARNAQRLPDWVFLTFSVLLKSTPCRQISYSL